jgi:HEAT repeat protein
MITTKQNTRHHEAHPRNNTADLIARLGSRNGVERQHAREALIRLGEPAIGPLTAALSADRSILRWEAAKAFVELRAPAAAPALVRALTDKDGDVRWLAAEALIELREAALQPLFESLMACTDSVELRDGAHHVLRALDRAGLSDIVAPVLEKLDSCEPELTVPFSAEAALARLEKHGA